MHVGLHLHYSDQNKNRQQYFLFVSNINSNIRSDYLQTNALRLHHLKKD